MKRELDRAYEALNVAPPTYEPAATGHIPEMLELIGQLIARGHAYAAEDGSGDVYFDVRSWPSYGELTHQKIDDMEAAEDADPRGKRDPRDFALWKGWKKESEPETAAWPSPWGPGRPGWHIECSAMAGKYLGTAFDIHGGGVDLRFPHHENEQAQSRAAGHPFASYWMHNAWITTAGEKMSKSLGNSLLIPEVLKRVPRHRAALLPRGRALPQPRRVQLRGARRGRGRLPADRELPRPRRRRSERVARLPEAFAAAMDDDLGTPAAVAVLYDAVREGNRQLAAGEDAGAHGRPGARDARRARPRPGRPGLAEHRRRRRQAHRRRRRARGRAARAARRGPRGQGLRRRRRHPRPDQGRRHRGRGHPRRPEVEPSVPGVSRRPARASRRAPQPPKGHCVPGNSAAQGLDPQDHQEADRGSGGRVKRGLEGKGPTPKAKDRPYHQAHKAAKKKAAKAAAARGPSDATPATPSGSPAATPWSRRCARGSRSTAVYVAEGAERDGRLREAFRLASEQRHQPARGHQGRARPDDHRRGAPGPGRPDPGLRVRPPRRPARPRQGAGRAAAGRGARPGHRPAQPRRRDPQRGRRSARTASSSPSGARPA